MAGKEGVAHSSERPALENRNRRRLRRIWDWIFGPRPRVGVSRARATLGFVAVPVFGTIAVWVLYWALLDSARWPHWIAVPLALVWCLGLFDWRSRARSAAVREAEWWRECFNGEMNDRIEADRTVDEAMTLGNDLMRRNEQLRSAAAAALERTQVDDSGEATAILEGVVALDGTEHARRYPTRLALQTALQRAIALLDADVFDRGEIEGLRVLAAEPLGGEA